MHNLKQLQVNSINKVKNGEFILLFILVKFSEEVGYFYLFAWNHAYSVQLSANLKARYILKFIFVGFVQIWI